MFFFLHCSICSPYVEIKKWNTSLVPIQWAKPHDATKMPQLLCVKLEDPNIFTSQALRRSRAVIHLASGSGSVLNLSVLRRKYLLVACPDSLGESGECFIFSDICSQVFIPRYTIFPYKMIPKNDTSSIAWQWLPGLCPAHES